MILREVGFEDGFLVNLIIFLNLSRMVFSGSIMKRLALAINGSEK